MDDLDQVLEALSNLQRAEGLGAVQELLGPELASTSRAMRQLAQQFGPHAAREVMLKIGRLYWQKLDHKGNRNSGGT